jgi:predicted negative regulator of RcsB-dependent stress response
VEVYNVDDQARMVKTWMKKNVPTIIVGLVLGLIVVYGLQYWRQQQAVQSVEASNTYELLLSAVNIDDRDRINTYAQDIIESYPETPYASMAQFFLTKLAIGQGELDQALEHLQWVIDNSKVKSLKQIARLRSARVLLAQNKPKQALAVLSKVDDKSYDMLIYEIRGDVYYAMNQTDKAKQAYETAMEKAPEGNILKPILVMKLNSLAILEGKKTAA